MESEFYVFFIACVSFYLFNRSISAIFASISYSMAVGSRNTTQLRSLTNKSETRGYYATHLNVKHGMDACKHDGDCQYIIALSFITLVPTFLRSSSTIYNDRATYR